ncbi:MAG: hypothetical protein E7254_08830 [Lachnospiraceae bacterium]|nr:hypothetical protein [Lachnospiraceae bacterium]
MSCQHYFNIIVSRTQTKFASCIRHFGNMTYNHTSVYLDDDVNNIYAFARPEHFSIFKGTLVKESLDRFTLRRNQPVPVKVLRFEITEEQYSEIQAIIYNIYNDPEYIYNLFSVISYPITKGFDTYKAYSCIEFSMTLLKKLGYQFEKPIPRYKPDDLIEMFKDNIYKSCDIRDLIHEDAGSADYFSPISLSLLASNAVGLFTIIKRTLFFRNYSH